MHVPIATYNAVWATALGLNMSDQSLQEEGWSLTDYRPTANESITKKVLDAFESIDFQGIAEHIDFNTNRHSALPTVTISQVQNSTPVAVAVFIPDEGVLDFELYPDELVWSGDTPPSDSPRVRTIYPPVGATIAMTCVSLARFALACFFLTMNCLYRNHKVLKLSSPKFNNLVILGCMLGFLSVVVISITPSYGVPVKVFDYICN